MGRRQEIISQSITYSILHANNSRRIVLSALPAFFYTYWLYFSPVRADLFAALRGTWQLEDAQYRSSFEEPLEAMGDMGYSGSTFFTTQDARYLVKSIPRRFEHSFFRDDLLLPYAEYMALNPTSLLIHIMDFLQYSQHSLGAFLGLAPSHHIIMDNIKQGEGEDRRAGREAWETFDLKPMSYFYPERDVAGGALASEATKSKLADKFDDKIALTLDQAEDLHMQLAKDTQLLAKRNAVDYSLFLVRIPADSPTAGVSESNTQRASWRTGVVTVDRKFVYRAAILDFFWAKHKTHAKAMTGLIKSYNLIDRQGPMSVTTEAPEYRERFLKMCREIVEVRDAQT